jgi:hypothetical protein
VKTVTFFIFSDLIKAKEEIAKLRSNEEKTPLILTHSEDSETYQKSAPW